MSLTIYKVKATHAEQLLAKPGVVSVGVGVDSDGNPAIVVCVEALRADLQEILPTMLDGYPVVTEVTGPLRSS